jgi:hypothetical protein
VVAPQLRAGFGWQSPVVSNGFGADGFHGSHRYQVVSDAVACRRPGVGDPVSYKLAVVRVIGNYAGIQGSADLIGASGKIAV